MDKAAITTLSNEKRSRSSDPLSTIVVNKDSLSATIHLVNKDNVLVDTDDYNKVIIHDDDDDDDDDDDGNNIVKRKKTFLIDEGVDEMKLSGGHSVID